MPTPPHKGSDHQRPNYPSSHPWGTRSAMSSSFPLPRQPPLPPRPPPSAATTPFRRNHPLPPQPPPFRRACTWTGTWTGRSPRRSPPQMIASAALASRRMQLDESSFWTRIERKQSDEPARASWTPAGGGTRQDDERTVQRPVVGDWRGQACSSTIGKKTMLVLPQCRGIGSTRDVVVISSERSRARAQAACSGGCGARAQPHLRCVTDAPEQSGSA